MHPVTRRLRAGAEALLARADLAVVHRSNYERWLESEAPSSSPVPGPESVDRELRQDNPRLVELAERYRSHPAARHSQWSDEFVAEQVDLRFFRGDNAYVWQRRLNAQPVHYALTTFYHERHAPTGLLDKLTEDRLFGAHAYDVDGRLVSRDLLDSVAELTFLEETLGLSGLSEPTILDIGAGYGRLAHRATAVLPVTYLCTDAVPASTFLCELYLRFRQAPGAEVIPLDEVDGALEGRRIDVAVNVHSFSECPASAIGWWLDLLVRHDVEHLMIVPNGDQLLSTERSGGRLAFGPLVEARGFKTVVDRPKYAHSAAVQEHGIYPGRHLLFRRS
jgi:SAM-dependent methyltransferase